MLLMQLSAERKSDVGKEDESKEGQIGRTSSRKKHRSASLSRPVRFKLSYMVYQSFSWCLKWMGVICRWFAYVMIYMHQPWDLCAKWQSKLLLFTGYHPCLVWFWSQWWQTSSRIRPYNPIPILKISEVLVIRTWCTYAISFLYVLKYQLRDDYNVHMSWLAESFIC